MRLIFSILFFPAALLAFEFKDSDRVVLIGNTFTERAQKYGFLEAQLTLDIPAKNVTFRNLGWSGDSVFGHARSYFGPPKEGLERLKKQLQELKPTVVIAQYGAVAAFEGKEGIKEFILGYAKWIDLVQSSAKARIVLVSPAPAETIDRPPLPSLKSHNENLRLYRDAIKNLASTRLGVDFADFFEQALPVVAAAKNPITDNGLHFGEEGYAALAHAFSKALGLKGETHDWSKRAKLLKAIVRKNQLFFHRYRPQNETYIFGFRKREQGRNAKEIPMFDPLIEEKEKEIAELIQKEN